jgi:hypothetical protein
MKAILFKLFFGKPEYNKPEKASAYRLLIINLASIWNNNKHHDIGFEKILRLFLVGIQIFFLGIHIRNFFGKFGTIKRNVAVEFFVLFKTILPLFFMYTGLYHYNFAIITSLYFLTETICYVASMIFVSDIFVKPRSYRRNILMLFFNYLEIALGFSVVYAGLHLLSNDQLPALDYIYFSIITSTTIGYGDLHPIVPLGKIVVCIQAIVVVAFIVLFLNFFGSKVENMHYDES